MNARWIDIEAQDGGRFKGYLSLPHQAEKGGKVDSPGYCMGAMLAFLATCIG